MVSLKDILERYKGICESFVKKTKKTCKTGLIDKGDSVFELPEDYIEIALMKIIKSRGISEVDIDCSEILQENPIDKSKWVPTLVYIDNDDTLGVRWDKFLAYNTECGCIDVYEDSDTYESFYSQNEQVQTELYREVMDALGMEYVEPKTVYYQTLESFVSKVSRKRSSDLVSDIDYPDGVYILHETLGVRDVEGWNPNDNEGVVGVLVIEDGHKIVVALEDSPKNLLWLKERNRLINEPVEEIEDAESDFNGEYYCRKLNSPDFPAAYYCKTYNKGERNWHLPSSGELWLICRHLEEIQNVLETVGGQKLVTAFGDDVPWYWSSTESSADGAWGLFLSNSDLGIWNFKVSLNGKVRPVSNFNKNKNLKESFTKKIKSTRKSDLNSKPSFVLDNGVYVLHETLGLRSVEGWNIKDNQGVVGVVIIDPRQNLVISKNDSPMKLTWSVSEYDGRNKEMNVNKKLKRDVAKTDLQGEKYAIKLRERIGNCPASDYCLSLKDGGRKWYLPSAGQMFLIYDYINDVQNALIEVGGHPLRTGNIGYWTSTERTFNVSFEFNFGNGQMYNWSVKNTSKLFVRPVSTYKNGSLEESFTKKISSKKNTDLISEPSFVADGVYILHETLGVKTVEGWNKKFNNGVVGILVVEDEHQIVLSLEDSPERFHWSKKRVLVNQPIDLNKEDAKSDFNGEEYCRNLNSPDFPAAYYCLNYKKGGLDWYLPSAGELWLIYRHLKKIQIALKTVKGKKLVPDYANFLEDAPCYWSSTESNDKYTWALYLNDGLIRNWGIKVRDNCKVRPVSNFNKNFLKESFTKKISKKTNQELQDDADESILPKNYIELALMSVLCSAKKEGVCFHKPKFHYKDDFGDVYELSEVFLQNDGQEIGGYAQRHYLEIESNVYENGHMEEEPESSIYPFKDEDDEIKTEIYKRVIEHLGLDYVRQQKKWIEFNDNGFDYFDN